MFAYERGLGWNFATWKLYTDDKSGVIDNNAKLLSLKDVAAAGLFPSLHKKHSAAMACLNPPKADFILGDKTLAPTPAPPPDCGDGWWNYNWSACEYWVPPSPTPKPTSSPTMPCPAPTTYRDLGLAATGGAVIALVAGGLIFKALGRRPEGYATIPN